MTQMLTVREAEGVMALVFFWIFLFNFETKMFYCKQFSVDKFWKIIFITSLSSIHS